MSSDQQQLQQPRSWAQTVMPTTSVSLASQPTSAAPPLLLPAAVGVAVGVNSQSGAALWDVDPLNAGFADENHWTVGACSGEAAALSASRVDQLAAHAVTLPQQAPRANGTSNHIAASSSQTLIQTTNLAHTCIIFVYHRRQAQLRVAGRQHCRGRIDGEGAQPGTGVAARPPRYASAPPHRLSALC
jgi:hypothetical protein